MAIYKTYGSYTYTDDEIVAGRLDTIVSDLRRHGWNTPAGTILRDQWNGRTTFFLHCNTLDRLEQD